MEQVLSYTLISAAALFACKKVHEAFKFLADKFVQMETDYNHKRYVAEINAKYDELKVYSICLSIDYEKNKQNKNDSKEVLNKVIYSKIEAVLKKTIPSVGTRKRGDVLVITSYDFNSYDKIYDNILKALSNIRFEIFKRYQLVLIPSITTDAYVAYPNIDKVMKNHKNIKHCNFDNTSCSTKMFSKKYELMNNHKYSGVPIGEYSIIDYDEEKTYDLNIVNRNLSLKLKEMR